VKLADALRSQGLACGRLGSPMYADLLARAAVDVEAGGPVAAVLAGHEDDPGPSALALRLLGSVHRLVLERRAGALAASYPSVGGTWDLRTGWVAFRDLLADRPEEVRAWLDRPPQTNEVGRATALYGGLLHLPRDLPVRVAEIGSSAGLNLRADRFAHVDDTGRRFGPDDAEVVLEPAWRGRALDPWPGLEVVERLGSDLHPVDPTTTEGRLVLTAYVWPDQVARLERLRAAFRTAARFPVEVRRQDARSFVEALDLVDGTTTVLWHSVMWQYLPAADQDAILSRLDDLGAQATDRRRLAHLRAEPARRTPGTEHEFLVRLRVWPGGRERLLGVTEPHGLPTTWE
jgi:hypothetical protein